MRVRGSRLRGLLGLATLLAGTAGGSCQRAGSGPSGQGGSSPVGTAGAGGTGAPPDGTTGSGGTVGSGGTAGGSAGGATFVDGGVAMDAATGDVRSGDLADQGCATTTQDARFSGLPPDVLILFDRSGSMQEDLQGMMCASPGCGVTSKWSIATAVLGAFLPTTEATVNWGLKLFASGSSSSCSVSNVAEVSPAPSNAAAISAALAATVANSSTPTTAALMNAAAYLKTFTDPNPKFILLVTDGLPTCGKEMCPPGSNGGSPTQCDDANAIAMVKTVHDMGIPVFVLGIGTSSSPGDETLSMMATLGGYPRAASPAYYPIDSGDDLSRTLGTISGLVGSCYFSVTPPPKSGAEIIDVKGDGKVLPADPTNGWTYATTGNSAGIQLHGKLCEDYKSGAIKSVVVATDLICASP